MVFITFEGGEGSGKTTQIGLLADHLRAHGLAVTVTREPGGTVLGEQVRTLLLSGGAMSPYAEVLLFNAARAQLVEEVIAPALRRREIVICDRFADSTLAYQGYGRGLPIATLEQINIVATRGVVYQPNLTILLDLPVIVGRARKQQGGEWNRLDAEAEAFHERVRNGYLQMASANQRRWALVDTDLSVADVHETIMKRVAAELAWNKILLGQNLDARQELALQR